MISYLFVWWSVFQNELSNTVLARNSCCATDTVVSQQKDSKGKQVAQLSIQKWNWLPLVPPSALCRSRCWAGWDKNQQPPSAIVQRTMTRKGAEHSVKCTVMKYSGTHGKRMRWLWSTCGILQAHTMPPNLLWAEQNLLYRSQIRETVTFLLCVCPIVLFWACGRCCAVY